MILSRYVIYSRSELLDSHTKYNPICISIKVFTITRLVLDYNSQWGKAPFHRKMPRSGTRVYEWGRQM
jgi:hypothetical protein